MQASNIWITVALLSFLPAAHAQPPRQDPLQDPLQDPRQDPLRETLPLLQAKNHKQRHEAVQIAGTFGRAGRSAIEPLGKILREDRVKTIAAEAAWSLAKIGPESVPELARAVEKANPEAREWAVQALRACNAS